MAMKHHPDKGGDEKLFQEISAAYDVLSDPEKRELYNKYGKEGVEQGGGGGRSADDIFSMFFGGGGGGRRGGGRRGPQKGEDVKHPLKVSLEDLYRGKTVKISINRMRVKYPAGVSAAQAVETCSECRGRGAVMKVRQIGPGMIQQMQMRCPSCKGTGKKVGKGVKVVKERKILEVHVDKGMRHGQKITFRGEADEQPGMEAGDVILVLQAKEHATFKRRGADIVMEKHITLQESLCGYRFPIKHLDGRVIICKSKEGEITTPQTLKSIPGEGMPVHRRPFEKGRLFVLFHVDFPDTLTATQVKVLRSCLPPPAEPDIDMSAGDADGNEPEEFEAYEVDAEEFGKMKGSAGGGQAYDSDDEDGRGGGQRVQCAQQ